MRIHLCDYIRFRSGKAPDALKAGERDLGTVIALVPHGGPEQRPVVRFEGYRTAALPPGLLEEVGEAWPAEDYAAGAAEACQLR